MARQPQRRDGYAPLRDYAVVGDKRAAALIALDGSVDWLCPPGFDAPSVFAAIIDSRAGGRFELSPAVPFEAERRYRQNTNVLETTFTTAGGAVRVTDAMSMPITRPLSFTELVRVIEPLHGEVPMRWRTEPRFQYGRIDGATGRRHGVPVIAGPGETIAVQAHGAGEPVVDDAQVHGAYTAREGGEPATLAFSCFGTGPLSLSTREQLIERVEATAEHWERWTRGCTYDGPWRDAVLRSALALDLMVDERTSAIVAAPTMGLPEAVGGSRNYDYRYAWLRDGNLTMEAMLRLGYAEQVHASVAWMLHATQRTHPLLRPIHRLDGVPRLPDEQLDLPGYRHSQPVTRGNSAQDQLQLGNYGDVLDMVWRYVEHGNALDRDTGRRLAELADFVCHVWRNTDSGLWELGDREHYTQSKLACWLALHRARDLAERGELPDGSARRWAAEQERIRAYVEAECWSASRNAYTRAARSDELDAAVLLPARGAFIAEQPDRLGATVDALRRDLGAGGPLLYRYTGMREQEGAFLACSFWMVEALAGAGRADEAAEAMDALVGLASDVGLYSEQIDPSTGEFRGNLPQALTHLALVNAADTLRAADRPRRRLSSGGRTSREALPARASA